MQLRQIHSEIHISPAASTPNIQSSEKQLFLSFYLRDESLLKPETSPFSNIGIDKLITFHFIDYIHYKFGTLKNAPIEEHPYFELGLGNNMIHKVIDSEYLDEEDFNSMNHLIFTFSDSIIEIICRDYNFKSSESENMKEEIIRIAELL